MISTIEENPQRIVENICGEVQLGFNVGDVIVNCTTLGGYETESRGLYRC